VHFKRYCSVIPFVYIGAELIVDNYLVASHENVNEYMKEDIFELQRKI